MSLGHDKDQSLPPPFPSSTQAEVQRNALAAETRRADEAEAAAASERAARAAESASHSAELRQLRDQVAVLTSSADATAREKIAQVRVVWLRRREGAERLEERLRCGVSGYIAEHLEVLERFAVERETSSPWVSYANAAILVMGTRAGGGGAGRSIVSCVAIAQEDSGEYLTPTLAPNAS